VAAPQAGLLHLVQRHVDVVAARQVARRPDERVVVEDVEDAGDGQEDVVLAQVDLLEARDVRALAAATALAVPAPVATAATARAALVVGVVVPVGVAVVVPVRVAVVGVAVRTALGVPLAPGVAVVAALAVARAPGVARLATAVGSLLAVRVGGTLAATG